MNNFNWRKYLSIYWNIIDELDYILDLRAMELKTWVPFHSPSIFGEIDKSIVLIRTGFQKISGVS